MTTEVFIQEVTFTVITTIAWLVAYEFIKSKDGILRKISICFCIYEGLIYFSTGIHTLYNTGIPLWVWRTFINVPKACIWLWLYFYIRAVNKKSKT